MTFSNFLFVEHTNIPEISIDFYKKSGAIVDGLEQWKIVRMDKQIIEKYLST